MVAGFDGGALSSDGGVLRLRELERSMGWTRSLASCFQDRRDARLIEHKPEQLVAQRVLGLAPGCEDLNDRQRLRHDPLLGVASGKEGGEALASAPTLNRPELSSQRSGRCHKPRVEPGALLLKLGVQTLKRRQREVIIDLDATDDPLHGKQGGRFFHGYCDACCHLPLYGFVGGAVLWAQLRTANRDGSEVEAPAKIVPAIRRRCPKARIVVRAGGGFCREPILAWCEQNRVDHVIGLAERLGDKDNPRFIATSLARDGEALYRKGLLRAVALKGAEPAQATPGTIRLKLFKLAARAGGVGSPDTGAAGGRFAGAGALRPCLATITPVAGLTRRHQAGPDPQKATPWAEPCPLPLKNAAPDSPESPLHAGHRPGRGPPPPCVHTRTAPASTIPASVATPSGV